MKRMLATLVLMFSLGVMAATPVAAHPQTEVGRCQLQVISGQGSLDVGPGHTIYTHIGETVQINGIYYPPNSEVNAVVVHDDGSERAIEPSPVANALGHFVLNLTFPAGEQVEAVWVWATTDIECHDGVGVQVLQRSLDADAAAAPTSSPAPSGALPDTAVAGGPASVLALLMSFVLILAVEKLRRSRLRDS